MGVLAEEVGGGNCFWREMFEIGTFGGKVLAANMHFSGKTYGGWKIQAMCIFRIFSPKNSRQNVFQHKNARHEHFGGN